MLQTQTCKTAMYTHNAYMPILVQLTATLNGVCNSFWAYLYGTTSYHTCHQTVCSDDCKVFAKLYWTDDL